MSSKFLKYNDRDKLYSELENLLNLDKELFFKCIKFNKKGIDQLIKDGLLAKTIEDMEVIEENSSHRITIQKKSSW